jgi:hypothetical protein
MSDRQKRLFSSKTPPRRANRDDLAKEILTGMPPF